MSTSDDEGQGQGDGQGQGEGQQGGQGDGLAARVDGIEREQKEQRGVLNQILEHVSGAGGSGGQGGGQGGEGPPTYADFAGEVQRQIAEADKRRQGEEREQENGRWRDDITATVEQLKAENVPREPTAGVRGKLQRAFLGADQ